MMEKCVKTGQKLNFSHFCPKTCHVTPHFAGFHASNPISRLKTVKLKPVSLHDGKMCKIGQKIKCLAF